ncbi:MAG: NAD(P)-dependent oxidoreductase [Desulfovibrio sp.]|uniref:NAD(P)-dependent oxidoreductase n=1 Tax=Desulfovibrio sp. 7SRBS1 TaxID=3378064 RepID=UPI003B3EFE3B
MRIGCIGTGKMGAPIAHNLMKGGHEVLIYKRGTSGTASPAVENNGSVTNLIGDLASCEVVFTCLPLPQDVMTLMGGPQGLLSQMKAEAIYVDLSTIDPQTSHFLEDTAAQYGIGFLQCTLGKTPAHAERAEEPLFIGGNRECFERLSDLWPVIGAPAHYLGSVDAACAVKLVSNMIGMSNLVVLSEGLHILQQAGLDTEKAVELLQDTGACSFQMDVRGPWIAAGDYEKRFGLDLALKDVRLGCEMAEAWGMDVSTMRTVLEIFKKASAQGHGEEDCCGVHHIIS